MKKAQAFVHTIALASVRSSLLWRMERCAVSLSIINDQLSIINYQ